MKPGEPGRGGSRRRSRVRGAVGPLLRLLPGGLAADPAPPPLYACRLCGKLFDDRADRPACPECDSTDVERMG